MSINQAGSVNPLAFRAECTTTLTSPPMKGFLLTLTLVFIVSVSLPAALPRAGATASSSLPPRPVTTKAVISGLEEKFFATLPPVLVELSNLPTGAAVWVEVRRGRSLEGRQTGKVVESKFYLRKDRVGVLSVPGIHRACRSGGTWTLSVCMSDARGTTILNQVTFGLQPEHFAEEA